MKNRRTWEIFLTSILVFGLLSVYLPFYRGGTDLLSLALSVTSILFGLLIGFFITQMWNKYTSIRRESAVFRSSVLGLITNMRRLKGNEDVVRRFEDRMEKFLIAFTMISWDSVDEEDKYFSEVTDLIGEIEINRKEDRVILGQILDAESSAGTSRSKLSSLGKEGLMKLEWLVLITLSSIITVSVILLRDGSLFFTVLSTVLPSLVLLTMMILDDLDNLRWGSTVVSFEPAQDALESLGKKRFYETRYIDHGWIESPKDFRTEEDLSGELKELYEDLKQKDCLRTQGLLGPKL